MNGTIDRPPKAALRGPGETSREYVLRVIAAHGYATSDYLMGAGWRRRHRWLAHFIEATMRELWHQRRRRDPNDLPRPNARGRHEYVLDIDGHGTMVVVLLSDSKLTVFSIFFMDHV